MLVFGAFELLLLIEVKGGDKPGNFETQFRCYKEYMERSHGDHLGNLNFLPVLARHGKTAVDQLCSRFQFDIPSQDADLQSNSSFDSWWQTFLPQDQKAIPADEMTPLLKRMLMTSSLVLTSLPQQLSQATPESHLIILRYHLVFIKYRNCNIYNELKV